MELDFSEATQNLCSDYKTASGFHITDYYYGHYGKYRDVFCNAIKEELNLGCEFDLQGLLTNAQRAEFLFDLFDFTEGLPNQSAHISAFGLVILDRLCRASSAGLDHGYAFELHEELITAYESMLVSDPKKKSAYSSALADKRHKEGRKAKSFVIDEWEEHKLAYKENKSAFSRDYVKRVINEFGVRVTEKQMREVWLQGNPDAANG